MTVIRNPTSARKPQVVRSTTHSESTRIQFNAHQRSIFTTEMTSAEKLCNLNCADDPVCLLESAPNRVARTEALFGMCIVPLKCKMLLHNRTTIALRLLMDGAELTAADCFGSGLLTMDSSTALEMSARTSKVRGLNQL